MSKSARGSIYTKTLPTGTARKAIIPPQAPGGLAQQAIAALENALVDVKARALGVPVTELLNGPVRERLRLYWSHCGSYRLNHAATMGTAPLRSLDDVRALGREVRERGFTALKTNIFRFDRDPPFMYQPGFASNAGWPELNVDQGVVRLIADQMAAFREGAGAEIDLLLDLNFNFKTEGYLEVAKAIAPYRLMWLEIDSYDPKALALIRQQAGTPVASCESLFGRRQFRPFLDAQAVDVALVDVPWNGILEGMKIAALAECYEVNCAPHNFYGNLSTMMSAHFCAAIPNFRIMEIDIDDVPWKDEVVSPPVIADGHLVLTDAPGWGVEVNEAAIRAHPAKA
jgi:L-alanine-DL-glutamate epimerase-like enolase superfamily enzyme